MYQCIFLVYNALCILKLRKTSSEIRIIVREIVYKHDCQTESGLYIQFEGFFGFYKFVFL